MPPQYVVAQTGAAVREVRKTLTRLRKVIAADKSDDENAPTMAGTLVLDDMVEFFLTQVRGLQRKGLVRS